MKAGLSIFLLAFIINTAHSQEMNRTIKDERYNRDILIGYCNREGLKQGDFGEDYELEYNDYEPRKGIVRKLARHTKGVDIVIILATWCPDSQEQVPRFYKILDEAGISDDSITLICVDGYKKVQGIDLEQYNAERVPTFIFYSDGKEAGRIIEMPEESLEEDFYSIVKL